MPSHWSINNVIKLEVHNIYMYMSAVPNKFDKIPVPFITHKLHSKANINTDCQTQTDTCLIIRKKSNI